MNKIRYSLMFSHTWFASIVYRCFFAINAARDTDCANDTTAIMKISEKYLSTPRNGGTLGVGSL